MSLCFFCFLFLSCFIFIYLFCIIYHTHIMIYIYDIIYYVIMYRSTLLHIIYFTSQVDFGWEIEPYHAVPRPRNNPMFLKWKIIKKIMLKDPQELTDHMRCPHFTGKMAKRDAEKGTTFRGRSMPQSRLRNRMPCVPARERVRAKAGIFFGHFEGEGWWCWWMTMSLVPGWSFK